MNVADILRLLLSPTTLVEFLKVMTGNDLVSRSLTVEGKNSLKVKKYLNANPRKYQFCLKKERWMLGGKKDGAVLGGSRPQKLLLGNSL